MAQNVSFDEYPELFSYIAHKLPQGHNRRTMRDLVQDAREYVEKYFSLLPPVDQQISHLYYIEQLSQDQISKLFGITQAAVSRRLKFIEGRLRFLLKQPTQNPTQVSEDFTTIFPADLVEFAFFFYHEYAQNRVKYFIKTSQSGAANKFNRVLAYLEKLTALPETGPYDPAALAKLGLASVDPSDIEYRRYLGQTYLEYFRYIKSNSSVMACLYKKNDLTRADALMDGESII